MFKFFFLLVIFLILPDSLIWWNYTRLYPSVWRTLLVLIPTMCTLLCMLLLVCQVRVAWLMQATFLLIICVAVPKLVFILVSLLGKLVAAYQPAVQQNFVRVGIICASVMLAIQLFGAVFGWRHLQVVRRHAKLERIPEAFRNYRVVQISDLHVGTYGKDASFLERLVDSVNAEHPDLIVFTGDLVNTSSDELRPFIRVLSRLRAKDGVYSVLGNHDYCKYHPGLTIGEQKRELSRIIKAQRMMGWKLLMDEHAVIRRGNDSLYVIGVQNIGSKYFYKYGNLQKAMKGIPDEACSILLTHDPWHWRSEVVFRTNIPFTLAGHTHAWQMQNGSFSPAQWLMPEWGGLYHLGDQQLYVSTGIGGSVPYRLGAWPTIEVFTFV